MAKRRSKQDIDAKQDPSEVRDILVQLARRYRVLVTTRPWAEERRHWRRIMRLSESLEQAVLVMTEDTVAALNSNGLTEEARCFRQQFRDPVLRGVSQIKNLAKMADQPELYFRPPRLGFQFDVLKVWTLLGGQLRFSRHPKTGRPQGPLIKFFQAVTISVMGACAPSLESLPDIIRRKKRVETTGQYGS